jgi:hypothetical protein
MWKLILPIAFTAILAAQTQIDGYRVHTDQSTPATPSAGRTNSYTKSGALCSNSSGSGELCLGLLASLPAAARLRPIVVSWSGSGTSGVLQDSDDEPALYPNDYGVTETITHIYCKAIGGTPTVMLVITGGSNILSGNLTCGNGTWVQADGSGGRPSISVTTITSGQTVDFNVVSAGGVATEVAIRVVKTL